MRPLVVLGLLLFQGIIKMKNSFWELVAVVAAVFAPIKPVVITVCVIVFFDLIFGVAAAYKRGEKITSSGFKTTVAKIFLYESALILAYLTETYLTGPYFPASKLVSAMIGVVELKSILENIDSIYGKPMFQSLIAKLTQKEQGPSS